MFDVTSDDISQLNDIDLRELVGRLCEAELISRGYSPSAVTWGGSQTAADGGLDVRVELPTDAQINGFIPRGSTGFQVKLPDMPRAKILAEMRPKGKIRRVIQNLVSEAGAYIIVSAKGATADSALQHRRDALREGLSDVKTAGQLHTDFYDRTRLATWVRLYPGLVVWVKEKIGRSLLGWKPYGAWSGNAESVDAEYLLDDKLRLHMGKRYDTPAHSLTETIDELRDVLAQAGAVVRLIGLSGVGKTRLVQALFDAKLGRRPLPSAIAIYTNLSDNPEPQPIGLASDLIANRARAVIVIDNCPPALHERLVELCSNQASTVSVLTVEYDIRDDQPEGTQVVTLDTSSSELIVKLLHRRFSHLSQVDARTIANVSGGNARIAIALGETVKNTDSIAGLSNEELFQRLFRQRQTHDTDLLLAAQACSLVYSFEGESLVGENAELPTIASLIDFSPSVLYRHVAELSRRELVQKRGPWRAVLPHAIANRLAARALENIPFDFIKQVLIDGGSDRLARSFSRRLSFLHAHTKAVEIATNWLSPHGLLGNLSNHGEVEKQIFENLAPVAPEAALNVLERAFNDPLFTPTTDHSRLLLSLAYEPALFDRSAILLVRIAVDGKDVRTSKFASETFVSLFTIYLSGTNAGADQRLAMIESILLSPQKNMSSLGILALGQMLRTGHFSSSRQFEFGARSRDFGYAPKTQGELREWYSKALLLLEKRCNHNDELNKQLRNLFARNFRNLWSTSINPEKLEVLLRMLAGDRFWYEGWAATRQILAFDGARLSVEEQARLQVIASDLSPLDLSDQIKATVLGNTYMDEIELNEDGSSHGYAALEKKAEELGMQSVLDKKQLREVLPEVLCGGPRTYSFGRGVAAAALEYRETWQEMVRAIDLVAPDQLDIQVMRGYLAEIWKRDAAVAENIFDSIIDTSTLAPLLPLFQSAVELSERSVKRLIAILDLNSVQVQMYANLAYGPATNNSPAHLLRDLLVSIASRTGGFDAALQILHARFFSDRQANRPYEPTLILTAQQILQCFTFERGNSTQEYQIVELIKLCFGSDQASDAAQEFAEKLRRAIEARETYSFENTHILRSLLKVQPRAVLEGMFGDTKEDKPCIGLFDHIEENPLDEVDPQVLLEWCKQSPKSRYYFMAYVISFAHRPGQNGPLDWSDQAKMFLANATNTRKILEIFIDRFRPNVWGGSRAAQIEANAQLLDSLRQFIPAELMPFVSQSQSQLYAEIAEERTWETKRDKAKDQRFE